MKVLLPIEYDPFIGERRWLMEYLILFIVIMVFTPVVLFMILAPIFALATLIGGFFKGLYRAFHHRRMHHST